jgi:quercetin dioxygenase-like cupin family protein
MLNQFTQPVSLKDVKPLPVEDGLERQVLAFSQRTMLVRHLMKAGWKGARHSHPHEQLVYVVRGRLRFSSGVESFEAEPGDSFVVPGGIEHQAAALDDAEVLDVFVPFREDYAATIEEN